MHRGIGMTRGTIAPRPLTTFCLLGVLVLAGCGGQVGEDSGWVADISDADGVRTVRTLSGSVWGAPAVLQEEVSIGSADGADAYLLGDVGSLWYSDGRIYAADRDVPVVRVYGPDGEHVMDIGRRGAGPGEFEQPLSVRVHPDSGNIFVRDDRHGRINVYTPDGSYLEDWPLTTASFMTSIQMLMQESGTLYTYGWFGLDPATGARRIGYIRVDRNGVGGDTLMVPSSDFEPWMISLQTGDLAIQNLVPFAPTYSWGIGADGTIVYGVSSRYRFTILRRDGSQTVVEQEEAVVPVDPDEGRWYGDRATANMRSTLPGWAWNGPAVPDEKPAYRFFWVDRAQRIWVLREGPGRKLAGCDPSPADYATFREAPCWESTWMLDVFDGEGRYLGPVEFPEGLQPYPVPYLGRDIVVALTEDAEGVPRIKRFRLIPPS